MKWISKSFMKTGNLPQFLDKVCHSERAERVEESSNTTIYTISAVTRLAGLWNWYFPGWLLPNKRIFEPAPKLFIKERINL